MGVPEPRAVEVHRDPDRRGGRPHLADRADRLHGAAAEVVGVLDHDERGLDLVGPDPGRHERHRPGRVEQTALARPRAAGDAGERRRRPELGAQDVGLLVGDELLAGRDVQAHAELVGQRPGRARTARPRARAGRRPSPRAPGPWGPRRTRRRRPRRAPSPPASRRSGRVRVSDSRSAAYAASLPSVLGEHLGDEERQLQALLVVQARVAHRLVAQVEVGVEDLLRRRRGTR